MARASGPSSFRRPRKNSARKSVGEGMALISRSRIRTRIDDLTLEQRALLASLRSTGPWQDLESFVMFIGYPRSGHSLVGSLLDAHPEVLIAHEQDALKYVDRGYSRDRLLELLVANAQRTARRGRTQTGYSYAVSGQYQGTWTRLRAIGDKKGGRSTLRLQDEPSLLDRLRETVGLPLKVIHVVRNPFDNIATIAARDADDGLVSPSDALGASIGRFAGFAQTSEEIINRLGPDEIHEVRHEDFMSDARGRLVALCEFLGVSAPSSDYLSACERLVYASPHRSRDRASWSEGQRASVEEIIARHPFFASYSFDD
jgi:Sulfotransferase family